MHSKMICDTQGAAILNAWHRLTMWRRQVHTLSLRTCLAQIQPPHRDSVKPSPLIETTSLLAAWTKGTGKWALTTNTKGVSFVGCSKIQYKFKHPYKHPCHRIINTVQYRTWKVHTTLWRRHQKGHDYQVSVHKRQHSPAGKWNFPDFRGKHEINRNKIMSNTVFVIMCLKKYIYTCIYTDYFNFTRDQKVRPLTKECP